MKHLEVLLNVPSMVVWIGLLFRLTIVHIRVELVKVYSRLISVLRTMATEKYDAVSQQRIMEESIKREMNVKRDESKFTINPNTLTIITRKVGQMPEITDEDLENFKDMKRTLEKHRAKPQVKSKDCLPETTMQECGWWWADGYENAAPRDTTRRGSLSKSTSYPSESAGQTHQTSSTSKTGLSQETISKLSYQRRKKEHEAARSHACDDDPYLDKVPLNDPPKSKRTCEETKFAGTYWNLMGVSPFQSTKVGR